jgi:hypothetical protein
LTAGRVRAPRPARQYYFREQAHRERVTMKQKEKKPKPNIINLIWVGGDWAIKTKSSTLKNKPPKGKELGGES